jgi:predicted NAD/FAD-binding protein
LYVSLSSAPLCFAFVVLTARVSLAISQIVFNPPTYPNFDRFLDLRRRAGVVEVIETEMTFSVSRDGGAFEWAGDGLRSVFCQLGRVLDLGMWRMLFDILRFNACAVRVLAEDDGDLSIGEYLRREGYSSRFNDDYLIVCHRAVSPSCLCGCFLRMSVFSP